MIAAAETGRDLIYFTFNREETFRKLEIIANIIANLNVSQVYELIGEYSNEIRELKSHVIKQFGIGQFMLTKLSKD